MRETNALQKRREIPDDAAGTISQKRDAPLASPSDLALTPSDDLLDSEPDATFDDITQVAATVTNSPVALVRCEHQDSSSALCERLCGSAIRLPSHTVYQGVARSCLCVVVMFVILCHDVCELLRPPVPASLTTRRVNAFSSRPSGAQSVASRLQLGRFAFSSPSVNGNLSCPCGAQARRSQPDGRPDARGQSCHFRRSGARHCPHSCW